MDMLDDIFVMKIDNFSEKVMFNILRIASSKINKISEEDAKKGIERTIFGSDVTILGQNIHAFIFDSNLFDMCKKGRFLTSSEIKKNKRFFRLSILYPVYWADDEYYEQKRFSAVSPLIKMIREVYTLLKISGTGHQLTGYGSSIPEIPEEDLVHLNYGAEIVLYKSIWSVNLFSPQEVKKYGREKLLNAPCELIEEWEDGAIFMMIHKDRFSSLYEERKKLREYLGVK